MAEHVHNAAAEPRHRGFAARHRKALVAIGIVLGTGIPVAYKAISDAYAERPVVITPAILSPLTAGDVADLRHDIRDLRQEIRDDHGELVKQIGELNGRMSRIEGFNEGAKRR
jgi:hypothetical protein